MAISDWSDKIKLVELQDDPAFTDDLMAITELVKEPSHWHVVLDFKNITFVNSANIARLVHLHKIQARRGQKVLLCNINAQVWGVFIVTGLHRVLTTVDNLETALLQLQLESHPEEEEDGPTSRTSHE